MKHPFEPHPFVYQFEEHGIRLQDTVPDQLCSRLFALLSSRSQATRLQTIPQLASRICQYLVQGASSPPSDANATPSIQFLRSVDQIRFLLRASDWETRETTAKLLGEIIRLSNVNVLREVSRLHGRHQETELLQVSDIDLERLVKLAENGLVLLAADESGASVTDQVETLSPGKSFLNRIGLLRTKAKRLNEDDVALQNTERQDASGIHVPQENKHIRLVKEEELINTSHKQEDNSSHKQEDNSSHKQEDNSSHKQEYNSSQKQEDNSSHKQEDNSSHKQETDSKRQALQRKLRERHRVAQIEKYGQAAFTSSTESHSTVISPLFRPVLVHDTQHRFDQQPAAESAIAQLVILLSDDLFHPKWQVRHGAAVALKAICCEISPSQSTNDVVLLDIIARTCIVLIFDRFGDFIQDTVVCPVREVASQLLCQVLSLHVPKSITSLGVVEHTLDSVLDTATQMLTVGQSRGTKNWQIRYSGMLVLKYMAQIKHIDDFHKQHILQVVATGARHSIQIESDDDVKSHAVVVMLSAIGWARNNILDPQNEQQLERRSLFDAFAQVAMLTGSNNNPVSCTIELMAHLLTSLQSMDDLSASANHTLELLAVGLEALLQCNVNATKPALLVQVASLESWVDTLAPFFQHPSLRVRVRLLSLLKPLLRICTPVISSATCNTETIQAFAKLSKLCYQALVWFEVETAEDSKLLFLVWEQLINVTCNTQFPNTKLLVEEWLQLVSTPLGDQVPREFLYLVPMPVGNQDARKLKAMGDLSAELLHQDDFETRNVEVEPLALNARMALRACQALGSMIGSFHSMNLFDKCLEYVGKLSDTGSTCISNVLSPLIVLGHAMYVLNKTGEEPTGDSKKRISDRVIGKVRDWLQSFKEQLPLSETGLPNLAEQLHEVERCVQILSYSFTQVGLSQALVEKVLRTRLLPKCSVQKRIAFVSEFVREIAPGWLGQLPPPKSDEIGQQWSLEASALTQKINLTVQSLQKQLEHLTMLITALIQVVSLVSGGCTLQQMNPLFKPLLGLVGDSWPPSDVLGTSLGNDNDIPGEDSKTSSCLAATTSATLSPVEHYLGMSLAFGIMKLLNSDAKLRFAKVIESISKRCTLFPSQGCPSFSVPCPTSGLLLPCSQLSDCDLNTCWYVAEVVNAPPFGNLCSVALAALLIADESDFVIQTLLKFCERYLQTVEGWPWQRLTLQDILKLNCVDYYATFTAETSQVADKVARVADLVTLLCACVMPHNKRHSVQRASSFRALLIQLVPSLTWWVYRCATWDDNCEHVVRMFQSMAQSCICEVALFLHYWLFPLVTSTQTEAVIAHQQAILEQELDESAFVECCMTIPTCRIARLISAVFESFDAGSVIEYQSGFIQTMLFAMHNSPLKYVRMVCGQCFARIVTVLPLEVGIPNPEQWSQSVGGEQLKELRRQGQEFTQKFVGVLSSRDFSESIDIAEDVSEFPFCQLRSYQKTALARLVLLQRYNLHGALCDDLGLGKTLVTLCAIARAVQDGKYASTVSLVACPATLLGHWSKECLTWFPGIGQSKVKLNPIMYSGTLKERKDILESNLLNHTSTNTLEHYILIASYNTIRIDREILEKVPHQVALVRRRLVEAHPRVDGYQQRVDGSQQAVDGSRQAVDGSQQAVNGSRQAVDGSRQAVDGFQQRVDGSQQRVDKASDTELQLNESLNTTQSCQTATASKWLYMVLDEAHNIRKASTKTAKAAFALGNRSHHRLVITGTPIHNGVPDLWSLFNFLIPGFLGSQMEFMNNIAYPIVATRRSLQVFTSGESLSHIDLTKHVTSDTDSESEDELDRELSRVNDIDRITRRSTAKKTASKEEIQDEQASLAIETLHRQVLPFVIRRLKEDVLHDLPAKVVQDVPVQLTEWQRKMYTSLGAPNDVSALARQLSHDPSTFKVRRVANDSDVKNTESSTHPLTLLLQLQLACSHPLLVLRSQRTNGRKRGTITRGEEAAIARSIATIKELGYKASSKFTSIVDLLVGAGVGTRNEDGETNSAAASVTHRKALIFVQWKGTIDLMEEQLFATGCPLHKIGFLRLDGSIPETKRQDVVDEFSSSDDVNVLLLTTSVGGQGLNLVAADMVVFLELDWNPMNDLQAMDRAHRIGQQRTVNVYRLVCQNTIEEHLLDIQQFKIRLSKSVLRHSDTLGQWGTQVLDIFGGAEGASVNQATDSNGIEMALKQKTQKLLGQVDADNSSKFWDQWDESEYDSFKHTNIL